MALDGHVAVLLGGVGGAKLAEGLAAVLPGERLRFIVNTGDDFWHWGLRVCPDLDTVMYTLAGRVDRAQGWGLAADSFTALDSLKTMYGIEPWFRLGDKDLATHLYRTRLLRDGESLTRATDRLRRALGIEAALLPMCDAEVATRLETPEHGELDFQEYFVKHRWQPTISAIKYAGGGGAKLSRAVDEALRTADIILIAPSNPWLSLGPILSLPGMRESLRSSDAPVVAMTPIIGGEAVKGPTAKIMRELGLEASAATVIDFYGDLLDGFIDDGRNERLAVPGLRYRQMDTLMRTRADKERLARATLDWIDGWRA